MARRASQRGANAAKTRDPIFGRAGRLGQAPIGKAVVESVQQGRGLRRLSCEDFGRHISGDVGQAEVAPGIAIRQLLVIQSHQSQKGGV